MGMAFYAGANKEDGTFGPVYDFKLSQHMLYTGDENVDPIVNKEYVYDLDIDMSYDSSFYILEQLGVEYVTPEGSKVKHDINDFLVKCIRVHLNPETDTYTAGRVKQFMGMCLYGIDRGATHIFGA